MYLPPESKFSFGAELNYSKSRDYRQLFKLKELDGLAEINGHVSGYWDTGYYDYLTQIDIGRFLAGDKGSSFTVTRDFRNGWKVGGFFTLTDASFTDFGEGSFDKGIFFQIPTHSLIPFDHKGFFVNEVIRPIQGDGGAKMVVPNRLYDRLSKYSVNNLKRTWPNIWR